MPKIIKNFDFNYCIRNNICDFFLITIFFEFNINVDLNCFLKQSCENISYFEIVHKFVEKTINNCVECIVYISLQRRQSLNSINI